MVNVQAGNVDVAEILAQFAQLSEMFRTTLEAVTSQQRASAGGDGVEGRSESHRVNSLNSRTPKFEFDMEDGKTFEKYWTRYGNIYEKSEVMTDDLKLSGCFNLYKNYLTSPTQLLNGVKWHTSVDRSKDRQFLVVSIHNNNASYLQHFDTNITINLECGEIINLKKTFDFKFDYRNNTFCINDFISIKEYDRLRVYNFSIDVVIHFLNIPVIRKTAEEIDFCDTSSTFNDIILKFKDSPDKVIYSSRAMLSIHSKVFNVMFNSDFDEKNEKTIELDENFEEFKTLLKAIYPTNHVIISSENIESLMKLADKYDMAYLMDRCVGFLDNVNDVPIELKLLLSDRYSLPSIHSECIQSFNDGRCLEKFQNSEVFENLSERTKVVMLKRTIECLREEMSEEPSAKYSRHQ